MGLKKKLSGLCINLKEEQVKLMFPPEKDPWMDCYCKVLDMYDSDAESMNVTLAGKDRGQVLKRSDVKNKDFILIAVDLDSPKALEKITKKIQPMKEYSKMPFYLICTTKKPENVDMPSVVKASEISDGAVVIDVDNLRIIGKVGKTFDELRNFNESIVNDSITSEGDFSSDLNESNISSSVDSFTGNASEDIDNEMNHQNLSLIHISQGIVR